jgi:hypothetical protein
VQNDYINVANKLFGSAAKSKCLETTLTDQNCVYEELESRLNCGNACYHAVHRLLSSRLLSKGVEIKIYKTEFIWRPVWM